MKILNSKKSTEVVSNWPFYIIFAVAIGFMVMIVVKTGNVSVAEASRIPPSLEDEVLLASRFYNLGECFAYVDPHTQQAVSGTIDLSRFTPTQMNTCYAPEAQSGFKTFNFRLRLEQGQQEITTNNYFHEDDFTLIKEVIVYGGGMVAKDRLLIYVQEKI